MSANEPVYGSKASLNSWAGFMEGKWAVTEGGLDPEMARQLKLQSIADQQKEEEKEKPTQIYSFEKSGAFTLRLGKNELGGRWQENGQVVDLKYTTLDGAPLQSARSQSLEAAEKGTQSGVSGDLRMDSIIDLTSKLTTLSLSPDRKRLQFVPLASTPGSGQQPLLNYLPILVRCEPKKAGG